MHASIASSHEEFHHAPEEALSIAIVRLQQSGERLTAPRRAVLDVLARHHDHLTADEVAEILAQAGIHRATVYRTFDVLTRSGIIAQRQRPGAAVGYHLVTAPAGHEHLHAVCRSCGTVAVLPADAFDRVSSAIRVETGFSIEPEQSALVGLCTGCRPNA